MQRRAFLATLSSAGAATVVGCLGRGDEDFDVGMTPTSFEPETVTVSVGETVVWENTSSRGHTVTAYETAVPDGAAYFASGGFDGVDAARDAWERDRGGYLGTGQRYEHQFEVPGEHHYFCVPHERGGMLGSVVVEE